MKKFAFENLQKHTQIIRSKTAEIFSKNRDLFIKAFDDFDIYLSNLESKPVSLERNVRLILACKLMNHIYSGLILAESGLILDSIVCERNALETIAFHWLVCIDEKSAEEYFENDLPRPVEVRKRLEKYGVDISSIKELYASGSRMTHIDRDAERFQSQWATLSQGKLFFGGAFLPKDQSQMFEFLPALLYLFQQPLGKTNKLSY